MFTRRLAVAIGLLFALIGAQGPEFSQQYRQRLGGALDELSRIVAEFDADAARQAITPSRRSPASKATSIRSPRRAARRSRATLPARAACRTPMTKCGPPAR